jgi:AcrR family transcriptional regulator
MLRMPEADPSVPARPVPNPRVRARNSRRILDSARSFIERHGLDNLSMRRFADEADVSVRTLYNLFGDKQGLVAAIIGQSFEAMDTAADAIEATDPIERIWEAVAIAVDATTRHVPKPVVAAVVADPVLYRRLSRGRDGRGLILAAMRDAADRGVLGEELSAELLVQQTGTVFLHLLGRWAADEIDERTLRAGVLHALDVCLLAIARPRARTRLLEHAAALEPFQPHLPEH